MRPRRSGRKPVARSRQAVDCPADAVALLFLAMASNTLPPTLLRDERAALAECLVAALAKDAEAILRHESLLD